MKLVRILVVLSSALVALAAFAVEVPQPSLGHGGVFHGGNILSSKANRDSVFLLGPWGSNAQANGQFEDASNYPAWNGWTSVDHTQPTGNHWHISDYNAAELNSTENNLAVYCGDESIPACSETDVDGGYENSYNDILQFTYTVVNPAEPCDVSINGIISYNTEPGYDYTNFRFVTSDGIVPMASLDGSDTAHQFFYTLAYDPDEYIGENHDQVRFEIVVTSDGAWSDADCLYSSNGACQVDDLRVQCSNGNYDNSSDFQNGLGVDWVLADPIGFGDFARLWTGLEDIDPCQTNFSPQVAFIDDGTQYPGVGPSYCMNWCYGPGGYIVNVTGGASLGGVNYATKIYNSVQSPVLNWPGSEYVGARLTFSVFRHEDLTLNSPGIFYNWGVRSAVDLSDLDAADWESRNFAYYGSPEYVRADEIVTDLLVPGATVVQVQLTVWDSFDWAWNGADGYPAPYFDNVRLVVSTDNAPVISTRELDLAQDNFPEIGSINMDNLASMNVRFDAALNQGDDLANVPGDSIVCNVSSRRAGGQLIENRLYYTMYRNPVFNSVRDASWGATGFVDGEPVINNSGNPVPDQFAYDLPDSGFLFPGDVLHYYFSATDEVNHADSENATMPMDISSFGDFTDPQAYNPSFKVHCLPSLTIYGHQPPILLWNDYSSKDGENKWFDSLDDLTFVLGEDYDYYYTNAASSGVGNGLGGRATADLLSGYHVLLYSSGTLSAYTISNGDDYFDPGNDVPLLTSWFEQNDVNAFFCGDGLVTDLHQSGPLTSTFLTDYLNVIWSATDIRPLIHNQVTPMVLVNEYNSVFDDEQSWIANGGCRGINTFDAVTTGPGAERLARFTNPADIPSYEFSAATLNHIDDDIIISIPFDFSFINYDGSHPNNPDGDRTQVLQRVLDYFGFGPVVAIDLPDPFTFTTNNYPNPFNPSTRISFTLPKDGHFGLKVFNVRGELVKTLIDEVRSTGVDYITWDGTNDQGSTVSSGIYFYEARNQGEVKVGKMTLVK